MPSTLQPESTLLLKLSDLLAIGLETRSPECLQIRTKHVQIQLDCRRFISREVFFHSLGIVRYWNKKCGHEWVTCKITAINDVLNPANLNRGERTFGRSVEDFTGELECKNTVDLILKCDQISGRGEGRHIGGLRLTFESQLQLRQFERLIPI